MSDDFLSLFGTCTVLALIQFLAALPWLAAADSRLFLDQVGGLIPTGGRLMLAGKTGLALLSKPVAWAVVLLGILGAGAGLALFLQSSAQAGYGRIYGSILQFQLTADLFVLVFFVALTLWPKGGAVALSAFRESLRQPMFWLLFFIAQFLMWLMPLLPYFTLGEDLKMVKELGYDLIMLFAVIFAVIAASASISEEIEGRTAVTLMSKPVSRRQFLLGKFLGIFMGAGVMMTLLGWSLVWMFLFKENLDPPIGQQNQVADPVWVTRFVRDYVPSGDAATFVRGVGLWFDDAAAVAPGLVIVSGQVMILLAIAVALATRLPMVVNIPVCLVFYFLGHLTPILIAVSRGRGGAFRLVEFMAQVFDTVLPGLEHFSLGAVIVRDAPLPAGQFALYTGEVTLYALLYTAIALLFGLILFEDRDLA
jgi:ABC-type transport system involved in multi-copper enzyme maturation permease subunit